MIVLSVDRQLLPAGLVVLNVVSAVSVFVQLEADARAKNVNGQVADSEVGQPPVK